MSQSGNHKAHALWVIGLVILAAFVVFAAWLGGGSWSDDPDRQSRQEQQAGQSQTSTGSTEKEAGKSGSADNMSYFQPPSRDDLPDGDFGDLVRHGEKVFRNTQEYAGDYVGNDNELSCANCHLDAGRKENSAPLWAAWVLYPKYRGKNDKVNDFAERIQGCFTYSMNGKAPPRDSKTIQALQAYSYWLAQDVPTGKEMPGGGYPDVDKPDDKPSYERGRKVYAKNCALCHGDDGQGRHAANGNMAFPPLWGKKSFNWGAGMHKISTAAAFIKYNMPLGKPELSLQEAWDVAQYIDSHERPQDPRFTGSVTETRDKYHGLPDSMYGQRVNGHRLGEQSRSSQDEQEEADE